MTDTDALSVVQSMVGAINAHDVDAQVAHFHPSYESRQPAHPPEGV
jgi:hypothetical protein